MRRSALILATTPLFLVYGQMGLVDPWLAFLVSVAVAAKVCRSGSSPPRRIALAALEGSALGAALLSKGIVVALFPLGLRLGALVVRRRRTPADFDASDLGVLTLALLLVLAWVAVAWDVAGEPYVHAITLGQLERRLGVHAPHSRPFGFLPLVTLLGLLPWSLFGLNGLWRRERRLAIWTWDTSAPLLGWFVVPALLLSLLPAQQPHYLLPAVPAAALLVAPTASAPADPWLRRLLAGLALVLGGGLIAAALAPHELLRLGKGGALGLQGVLGDPAVRLAAGSAGGVLLALLGWPRRWGRAHRFWLRAATGSVVFFGCAVVVVSRADPFLMPRSLLESPALASAGRLAAVGGLRSAVCLATGRRDVGGVDEQALRRGLRGDPSLVALVWRKSLRDLPGDAGQSSGLEEIGQGWFRGRPLVAVRSRVAGEASSTPP